MSIKNITAALVSGSLLAVSGCGGGGSPETAPTPTSPDPTSEEGASDSVAVGDLNFTSGDIQESATAAATARAKFGSVTQSSNVAGGATTDRASAAFNGSQLTFSVTRSDGSVLNFIPPTEEVRTFAAPDEGSGDQNWDSWTLRPEDGNSRSIAFVAANWNRQAAQTEWLAQGFWINTGNADNPTPRDIEIGTFVDGPEIERDADLSGLSGTATYNAVVSGLYVSPNPPGEQDDDAPEVGIFNSRLSLTANFGSNKISGCVGCASGIEITEISDPADDEEPFRVRFRIRLGEADINDNGRVESGGVSVETSLPNAPITSEGSWSGRFSSENAGGLPRAVAGTVGASFRLGDATSSQSVVLVGSFLSPRNDLAGDSTP